MKYKYRHTETYKGHRIDVKSNDPLELSEKIEKARSIYDADEKRKDIILEDYANEWFDTFISSSGRAEQTIKDYRSRLDSVIIPYLGLYIMRNIKPADIQSMMFDLKYSKTYLEKIRYTVNDIMDRAVLDGTIEKNPCIRIELPKSEDGSRRALTPEEQEMFLKTAKWHKYGTLFMVMYFCGLRPIEVEHLRIDGINLDKKRIHIKRSKTKAGLRDVPIPDALIPYLEKLTPSKDGYAFCNNNGNRLTKSDLTKRWRWFYRDMNIENGAITYRNKLVPVMDDLVPYNLRHTCITNWAEKGIPINVTRMLAGHTDISITSKYYIHSTEKMLDDALNLMNK